ncbi:MAG TPA: 1-deoxy-D-xylulose-5-phosphate synthase N-terminal domain-containing protein, partial [Bdellovibrionota bacterium]|nr:1-deoxy-D-xylulose-5-phosphate synthase N-terminal domain-containing protein [Bdellovibrionota bacterium]
TGPLGPLLVVLNDNQMSISPNVGGIPSILAEGRVGELFRLFGFDYLGPIDGHDLDGLIDTLNSIRSGYSGRPVLLHALTEKGRGYAPAEHRPAAYHGVSPVPTKLPTKVEGPTWSQAFGESLCKLAERDEKIVAVTAAMPDGTGLSEFARRFPSRFFDVGIAEAHAVTFAAGLATQGYKPVVAVYSTFLQRAFDSLIHDLALQRLGVTLAIDRAGFVGADGPTHHGAFDLSYLGLIPGMTIHAPAALEDLEPMLEGAVSSGAPVAIRYPRGSGQHSLPGVSEDGFRWLGEEADPSLLVFAAGASAARALEAANGLEGVRVAAVTRIKPLPAALFGALEAYPAASVLSVEDGAAKGGFGQTLKSEATGRSGRFEIAAYADRFYEHGSIRALEEAAGLSVSALRARMASLLTRA